MDKSHEETFQHFTQDGTQMANKHVKKCSTPLAIREIETKTTIRYHPTPIRMDKTKVMTTPILKRMWETQSLVHQRQWEYKMVQGVRKMAWQFLTKLNRKLSDNPVINTTLGYLV